MPVDGITSTGYTSLTPDPEQISSRDEMTQLDFLEMLTAQLKAQDPMNPLDGQDFATQLAQFSSLQELQGVNSTLEQNLQADLMMVQSFNNTMAATLIGRVVRADSSELTMSGSNEPTLNFSLGAAATDVQVEILDADGAVVRTLDLNACPGGENTVKWDGKNDNGGRVTDGAYTYRVKAVNGDDTITATTYMEGVVTGVSYVDGSAVLRVNGQNIQLSQVLSIAEAQDEG